MADAMRAGMGEIENEPVRPKVTDAKGILKQNREFLDFFWDIAKPEQEVRLKAIENLIQYLKKSDKPDELKYTLKRLVDGLSHTRETARPGFSLALAQVLNVFEEVSLQSTLEQIKQKHDLQKVKKKFFRNAAFGNFFGTLALFQSGRLCKEPQLLLECIRLLQSLVQCKQHLKDLPMKTVVDILSETTEDVFEEVLLGALQNDLSSAFNTPEQLQLLLVAMQRFPNVLKPQKLRKLLGTSAIVTKDNIPKLTEVLKTAACSVKKDRLLPAVALDLLQMSLNEGSFELFWKDVVIKGLLTEQSRPQSYMCYRLLGRSLPLLSLSQLQQVLSGEAMKHYGQHVVSAQLPERFKFAPEMETYVSDFLRDCTNPEQQLAVLVSFSRLTNQGYPVVPSVWKVVQHLQPTVLLSYVTWLKEMFCHPQIDTLVDFTTRRQQESQESGVQSQLCVSRLRKWLIPRLISIVDNIQIKKGEDMVMDISRFVFFHAFFDAKKPSPDIPETEATLSVPLDQKTREVLVNSFFSLLQHLNQMPSLRTLPEAATLSEKRAHGTLADGTLWIYSLVQYANTLLSHTKHVCSARPLTAQQREVWDSMLSSVESLQKKSKSRKLHPGESTAFQQLFLLMGIYLFKDPGESVDLMKDLQNCLEKAHKKKSKKKANSAECTEDEPHWVEVVVEILLSLLSQPSRLIRQVCKTVFTRICPHVTKEALSTIVDVLDPSNNDEDSAVIVTDEKDVHNLKRQEEMDEEEETNEEEDDGSSEEDSDAYDEDDEEEKEDVDQNFRLELMKVLQGQNALANEDEDSEDEDLDDETMMKLDDSLSALFSEQKKKIQAKKDEKERLRKEKSLVRDFKIKVLDLVEIFLIKQSDSPLVLGLIEPLLNVIESSMSSETNQQEQDFLRKAADIFRNHLCKAKRYCKNVLDMRDDLHGMLERLLTRAQRLADSSVSLYYFSASLFVVKVLRGISSGVDGAQDEKLPAPASQVGSMGLVDVERVTALYKEALCCFMTRRKSSLTGSMFIDLFDRFPVLCVQLMDTAVEYITKGVRQHQQGQASAIVLKGLQMREVQKLQSAQWKELCEKIVGEVAETLKLITSYRVKVEQEKALKVLELIQFLLKNIQKLDLSVNLDLLKSVLQSLNQLEGFRNTGQLEDTYWNVMKHFGILKPKTEKVKKETGSQSQQAEPKKKKGFLPESKKRKNRKKETPLEGKEPKEQGEAQTGAGEGNAGKAKNKKRNKKRKQQAGTESGQSPAKRVKPQPSKQKNKNKSKGGDE